MCRPGIERSGRLGRCKMTALRNVGCCQQLIVVDSDEDVEVDEERS